MQTEVRTRKSLEMFYSGRKSPRSPGAPSSTCNPKYKNTLEHVGRSMIYRNFLTHLHGGAPPYSVSLDL
jgi:hypothetical protein